MNKSKKDKILKDLIYLCKKSNLNIETSESNKQIVISPVEFEKPWVHGILEFIILTGLLAFFIFFLVIGIIKNSLYSILILSFMVFVLVREYIKYAKAENIIIVDFYNHEIEIVKIDFIAKKFIKPIKLPISKENTVKKIDRMLSHIISSPKTTIK